MLVQHSKRAGGASFPDPLYTDQWHLNNVGQFEGIAGEDVNIIGAWEAVHFLLFPVSSPFFPLNLIKLIFVFLIIIYRATLALEYKLQLLVCFPPLE